MNNFSMKSIRKNLHSRALISSSTFENLSNYIFSRKYSAELIRLMINVFFKTGKVQTTNNFYVQRFTILCPRYLQFLGKLIQNHLSELGILSNIIGSEPKTGFSNNQVYIVLFPQHFKVLPPYYLVFQLEQLAISNRFRKESYLSLLKNAIAVMEYSKKNLEYLQSHGLKNCFYVPIFSKVQRSPNHEPLHDVLFYGSTSSEHRQEFLSKLGKDFNVHIAKSICGEQTIEAIHNSKVIVNLHNYDNALLESTRIFECLSAGAVIVSEDGNDQNEYDYLSDFVDFVKSNNYDQLRSKISERLSNDNYKTQRIFIRDQLEKQFDRFGFGFSRMLLALGYISFDTFCKTWITKCLPPPKEGYVSIRNEKQINFTENFTFCTLRHHSKWIENELNTKFLCLLAKQNDLPYLTVDFDGKCSKEYLKQLSKYFLSQHIDHPILCSGIAFIPNIAYTQIISWNELPRIVNSDKYSLWDNFEKVDQGTIEKITYSPCLKD